jgi:hypothetical protein
MKIRTDFITNSSSSAFVVLKDTEYYKNLQNHTRLHLKDGEDISRYTGVYEEDALLEFINYFTDNEWTGDYFKKVKPLVNKYGLENLVLVMISDEDAGDDLPFPEEIDILFETEYH